VLDDSALSDWTLKFLILVDFKVILLIFGVKVKLGFLNLGDKESPR
jgi:hypothetical protein